MSDLLPLRLQAESGDPRAQLNLAYILIVGERAPRDIKEALRLIDAACAQGVAPAFLIQAVLAALGMGRPRSFEDAIGFLARAAALGDADAQGQLAALGGVEGFDAEAWRALPPAQVRFEKPRIFTIENFIPPAACAWLIAKSRARLAPAEVLGRNAGAQVQSRDRTNTLAGYPSLERDLVLQLLRLRVAGLTGVPPMHLEVTNVLHYDVGEEFKPHTDFITREIAHAFTDELERMGQRIGTMLIYLNDGYEGGETEFPLLNWRFKGKTGDALLFWNASSTGELEHTSRHAGLPVRQGEKWIVSQWMRARAQPLL